ncbi:Tyrosine-protein phosphatase non-receptor type 23 [Trichinella zimbabwensis]|uniref:Tyrosine-protein phosphatase non-receptor type 23 n=1 Tax=Trichinella zimbabwensis TaxID=268475 RepID=A0A0V1H2D3_9BILA|nr:Tyrosine-protein phosphatase non-receptor type 23 [Trichinella zimbabwensis]
MDLKIVQPIDSRMKLAEIRPRSFIDDFRPLCRVPFAAMKARRCKNSPQASAQLKRIISTTLQSDSNMLAESMLTADTTDAGTSMVVQNSIEDIRRNACYYLRLMFLNGKKNSISEKERQHLVFSWTDSIRGNASPAINKIEFEMASVLHNIASAYSYLAARLNRATSMDMQLASSFFQFSSGILDELRGKHSGMALYSHDFSTSVISFRYQLMLAQAQECMVERSMLDGIDEKYISELIMKAIQDYNTCESLLDAMHAVETVPSNELMALRELIDLKRTYYTALLHMSLSNVALKNERRGEVVARLRLAKGDLNGLERRYDQLPKHFLHITDRLLRVIDRKLSSTRYYALSEDEIAGAELHPCAAVSVVGPMALFEEQQWTDSKNSSTLYPERIVSIYKEMREVVIKPYLARHNQLHAQFKAFMGRSQLQQVFLYAERQVPEDIKYWANVLRADPKMVERLSGILNNLQVVRLSARTKLFDLDKRLKAFRGNLKKYQRKSDFKMAINYYNGTEKMVAKCQDVFRSAEQTGDQLTKAHKSVMMILDTLQKSLDYIAETVFTDLYDPCSTEVGRQVNQLRISFLVMFAQRMAVVKGLRKTMEKDDIVKKLNQLDEIGFHGRFMEFELGKYSSICDFLRNSFSSQENLLRQFSSFERSFRPIRDSALRSNEGITRRFRSMVECCRSTKTLEAKVDEGERFYARLHFLLDESLRRIEQLEMGATCGYKNIKADNNPCCSRMGACNGRGVIGCGGILCGGGVCTTTSTNTEENGDAASTASELESITGTSNSNVRMKKARRGSSSSKPLVMDNPARNSVQQRQAREKADKMEMLKRKLCEKGEEKMVALNPKLDLDKLKIYLENFKDLVDSLNTMSSNNMTELELEWQEIQRKCDIEAKNHTVSDAKKFASMNRVTTVLPYDDTRIMVMMPRNDYINASLVGQLCEYGPAFFIAQIPTKPAVSSFWCMLFESKIELLCLIYDSRDCNAKNFMPRENAKLKTSHFSISISNKQEFGAWTESTIVMEELRDPTRCYSFKCLHFDGWQSKSELIDLEGFVKFLLHVRRCFLLQKEKYNTIVALSLCGSSRCGIFSICLSACCEIMAGQPVPAIGEMPERLCAFRNNCITSKQDLYTCYMVVLTFLKNLCESQENGDYDDEEGEEDDDDESGDDEKGEDTENEDLLKLEEKMSKYTFADSLDLQFGGPSCSGLGAAQQQAAKENEEKENKCMCQHLLDVKSSTTQSMTHLLHLINVEPFAILSLPCKACCAKCACHDDSSDETLTD